MNISGFSRRHATTIGAYTLAAAIFIFGTLYRSSFASADNVAQLLTFASFIGFVALGQTAVILAGGFDLSVPWLVGLGGIGLARLTEQGLPGGLAVAVIVMIGALVGAVNGFGVTRLRISPIVMTLGVGGLVQAYLLSVGLGQATNAGVPGVATSIANDEVAGIPVIVGVWAVFAIAFSILLGATAYGRRVYATGTNDRAAAVAGVRVARVRATTYVISGAASTFGGVVLAGYFGHAYVTMGAPYLFASIAAVAVGGASILGGQGTYWGTVAGALTLTFLGALLPVLNLDQSTLDIVYGAVILIGVAFARSATAFAQRTRFRDASSSTGPSAPTAAHGDD